MLAAVQDEQDWAGGAGIGSGLPPSVGMHLTDLKGEAVYRPYAVTSETDVGERLAKLYARGRGHGHDSQRPSISTHTSVPTGIDGSRQ